MLSLQENNHSDTNPPEPTHSRTLTYTPTLEHLCIAAQLSDRTVVRLGGYVKLSELIPYRQDRRKKREEEKQKS